MINELTNNYLTLSNMARNREKALEEYSNGKRYCHIEKRTIQSIVKSMYTSLFFTLIPLYDAKNNDLEEQKAFHPQSQIKEDLSILRHY